MWWTVATFCVPQVRRFGAPPLVATRDAGHRGVPARARQSAASSVPSSANSDVARQSSPNWPHEDRPLPRSFPLKGREGDAAKVVLTDIGHNQRRALA